MCAHLCLAASLATAGGCALDLEREVHGDLILAPEVETFQPCDSAEPLWVQGAPALVEALRAEYERLVDAPYEPTYAVLIGAIEAQLDCGFCADYIGSFRIVRKISQQSQDERSCP